ADALVRAITLVGHRRTAAGAGAQVQRAAILGAEHAGEREARAGRDRALDASAVEHAQHTRGPRIGYPDGALGVQTDAVGEAAVERGEEPAIRERAVGGDVERRQPMRQRLRDDQRAAVGRDDRTVRKRQLVGGARDGAVGIDAREARRAGRLAAVAVEAEITDVGAAHRVHDHVVAGTGGQRGQIGDDAELAAVDAQPPPVRESAARSHWSWRRSAPTSSRAAAVSPASPPWPARSGRSVAARWAWRATWATPRKSTRSSRGRTPSLDASTCSSTTRAIASARVWRICRATNGTRCFARTSPACFCSRRRLAG